MRHYRGVITRTLTGTLLGLVAAILPASPAHAAPGQIVIVKTDQFADPVEGAVFQALLSDGDDLFEPDAPDGDTPAAQCTTGAGGECVLSSLAAGDYYVRELEAPAGYEPDDGVRGPIAVADDGTVVIDRATDLDGDGLSDGFLNVREITVGSLVVSVAGGDPDFALDPPEVGPFFLGEGGSATFDHLPAGPYTLTMTGLEDGLLLDGIDCGEDETGVDLDSRSVSFDITPEATVECLFTVSDDGDPYDGYDDDPGDSDFDFDSPFDETPDPEAPAGPTDPSGTTAGDPDQPETTDDPLTTVGTAADPPAPAGDLGPTVLSELPRTGRSLTPATALGTALLLSGMVTVAASTGVRRRTRPE